ncbi:hypothetical protein AFLA_003580 [Aspergillus flavus NRRL3357]|nr:hypothetical protein AFLA_003580 [Aspergillus flavus NRRL3357]
MITIQRSDNMLKIYKTRQISATTRPLGEHILAICGIFLHIHVDRSSARSVQGALGGNLTGLSIRSTSDREQFVYARHLCPRLHPRGHGFSLHESYIRMGGKQDLVIAKQLKPSFPIKEFHQERPFPAIELVHFETSVLVRYPYRCPKIFIEASKILEIQKD